MKANFSLRNLNFDRTPLTSELFNIDEEYQKLRTQNFLSSLTSNLKGFSASKLRLINNCPSPYTASQTLKDIYKKCKTNEDADEDSEDSESLERANELFQSMLHK